MTRVEGENSRLRHYLARLHRKTFCYSKSVEMLDFSIRLLIYYLKNRRIPMRGLRPREDAAYGTRSFRAIASRMPSAYRTIHIMIQQRPFFPPETVLFFQALNIIT